MIRVLIRVFGGLRLVLIILVIKFLLILIIVMRDINCMICMIVKVMFRVLRVGGVILSDEGVINESFG